MGVVVLVLVVLVLGGTEAVLLEVLVFAVVRLGGVLFVDGTQSLPSTYVCNVGD